MRATIIELDKTAARQTRWLVGLTWVLVVLTVLVVVLTFVLVLE